MNKLLNVTDLNDLTNIDIENIFNNIDHEDNQNKRTDRADNNFEECPNCDLTNHIVIDAERGVLVCNNCGQVIDNILDQNPEWKSYDDDKGDNSRCSIATNQLLPQSSLGTSIAGRYRSGIRRLHGWSAMPYKERSLNNVFIELQNGCAKGNLLKCIIDDAKILYKKISECEHQKGKNLGKKIIIRGINRKGLIAACVFFACRKINQARSQKEISDMFDLKQTELTRGCKKFLALMIAKKSIVRLNAQSSSPEHIITRFCKELKIKNNYIEQAIKIAKNIIKLDIASVHTPLSIATGGILLMTDMNNLPITKKNIADTFGVSEVTIKKTFDKLKEYKYILLNDQLIDKIIINSKPLIIELPDHLKNKLDKLVIYEKNLEKLKQKRIDESEHITMKISDIEKMVNNKISILDSEIRTIFRLKNH